jgi:phenylalanyl-tRNA synthetase beta chain
VKLLSPLSNKHEEYRLSLAPSMLEVISTNLAQGNKQLRFFEIGDVYSGKNRRETHLILGLNGKFDYYDLKSEADAILNFYNLDPLTVEFNLQTNLPDQIHPYINAAIVSQKKTLGFIYKLNPAYENSLKIGPTFFLELNLDQILKVANLKIVNQEFSKFQASSRDLSIEVPLDLPYQAVIQTLVKKVKNLVAYQLIDVYNDEELLAKKKTALTISFTFNNLEEQMSEVEINDS